MNSSGHNDKDFQSDGGKVLTFQKPGTHTEVLDLNWFDKEFQGVDADLVCLSHLRWDFVYQRPQHLLSRCAQERRVFFVEEPLFGEGEMRLDVSRREDGVYVVVPHLPQGLSTEAIEALQQELLNRLFREHEIENHILWYYTPMALGWSRHLQPLAVVYDCMDELSAFKGAPPALREREAELFARADLVFTGGQSLYEAKRDKHPNVYAFPSSIDRAHFAQARDIVSEPADQANIPHPRLGFFGVIDERLDIELLDSVAAARPDWQFVIIGPVVKIDPATLPKHANIHYLGGKSYKELPAYIAGWDVASLIFARNDSTRFISPTKTPEYLAAGKPVVSTSIRDVVRPYAELGLVRIADNADDFIKAAAELGMDEPVENAEWLERVDMFLAKNSWDKTWARMTELIEQVAARRAAARKTGGVAGVTRQSARAASASGTYSTAGD
jgi:UDP-galactopyranose mutase